MKIKVSVIIPTYNRLHYIKKCLYALFRQTSREFEIIIVDDGSTDGTYEYLEGMRRTDFILLKEKNKGPAAARNLGVKHSKADYIAFIDDDCIPQKRWVENIIKDFRELDADSLTCHTLPVYKNILKHLGEFERIELKKNFKPAKLEGLRPDQRGMTDNCAIKREIFNRLKGFDEKFLYAGEDPDFWFRLLKRGYSINIVDDLIVGHHQRINLWQLARRSFRFGFADTVNFKDHFKNRLFIGLRPMVDISYYGKFPFTVIITGNMFIKLIIVCAITAIFYWPLGLGLFLLLAFIMFIKSRSILILGEFYLRELATQLPMMAGKIAGSIRNGIICI
jgi:glycosyltransferase involved in cell wall biosynthesis